MRCYTSDALGVSGLCYLLVSRPDQRFTVTLVPGGMMERLMRYPAYCVVVKWRWIVEGTFGWFNWYRRLSKDYEYYTSGAEAWIKIASINVMLHRLQPG